jgi:hypothetical protein
MMRNERQVSTRFDGADTAAGGGELLEGDTGDHKQANG